MPIVVIFQLLLNKFIESRKTLTSYCNKRLHVAIADSLSRPFPKMREKIRVHTVMKSHEKSWNLKMHFPGLEKSWILGKMAEVMEKSWNFISLVQRFRAV